MLNLTENDITLIAESGETTTIPASGYVARVEYDRREVAGISGPVEIGVPTTLIPIIEEAPTEIIILRHEERIDDRSVRSPRWIVNVGQAILLVPREVAEAAHVLRHPLAERMVWVGDDKPLRSSKGLYIQSRYRSLRRVPRGEAK